MDLTSQQCEVELKLELNSGDATKLQGFLLTPFKHGSTQELDSIYFDTAGKHLRKAGFALRIRHIGQRRVQTLKANAGGTAGLFARPEWERDIEGDMPALDCEAYPPQEIYPRTRPG